jgi:hypothetical protein
MSRFELTKTRMANGVWEGILTRGESTEGVPEIRVMHMDQPVTGVEVTANGEAGNWILRVPVPMHAIADGVQTFTMFDVEDDTKLGAFTLIAGEALADDMRAEVDLLRAELDMLKRAFRRHCVETT